MQQLRLLQQLALHLFPPFLASLVGVTSIGAVLGFAKNEVHMLIRQQC